MSFNKIFQSQRDTLLRIINTYGDARETLGGWKTLKDLHADRNDRTEDSQKAVDSAYETLLQALDELEIR